MSSSGSSPGPPAAQQVPPESVNESPSFVSKVCFRNVEENPQKSKGESTPPSPAQMTRKDKREVGENERQRANRAYRDPHYGCIVRKGDERNAKMEAEDRYAGKEEEYGGKDERGEVEKESQKKGRKNEDGKEHDVETKEDKTEKEEDEGYLFLSGDCEKNKSREDGAEKETLGQPSPACQGSPGMMPDKAGSEAEEDEGYLFLSGALERR